MKNLIYLLLVPILFVSGCFANKDGTYRFKHLEYLEDNQVKTTDCNNLNELRIGVQTVCQSRFMVMTLNDNYYTFSMTEGHLEDGYFKIQNEDIYLSDTEDGNYKHTGWFHYKNGNIYYGINNTYIVLERK